MRTGTILVAWLLVVGWQAAPAVPQGTVLPFSCATFGVHISEADLEGWVRQR
jgi:hypothetical protein